MCSLDALKCVTIAFVVPQLVPVGSEDGLRVSVLWQAQHLHARVVDYGAAPSSLLNSSSNW